jgi:hypothetical protein
VADGIDPAFGGSYRIGFGLRVMEHLKLISAIFSKAKAREISPFSSFILPPSSFSEQRGG